MEENMTKAQLKARAEIVKQERLKRRWSQTHLANAAIVSLRTIQRLEKEGIAAIDTLTGVASAFDVDVEYLSPITKELLKKDAIQPADKELQLLPRIKSGKELTDIIGELDGEDSFQRIYDQINDKKAVDLVAGFFEFLAYMAAHWNTLRPGAQVKLEFDLTQELQKLESIGFHVFGIKREIKNNEDIKIKMSTIFIVPSGYPKIAKNEKMNKEFVPAVLSNLVRKPTSISEVLRPQNLSQL